MGRQPIPRPKRLTEKLKQIRDGLGLSQNELIQKMGLTDFLLREEISDFERGRRVPPLSVLLEYARVAGVYMDALVDDQLDLPMRLPCSPKHEGVRRRASRKAGGRS
ncbi:MAG: Helix-turn-helix domain [Acidobacteriota bacterium]|jgi:transcriptional regulator with XRE-family HTH domain|nr:Helix-turn-helix domain [Acidobacteriota bacterium]